MTTSAQPRVQPGVPSGGEFTAFGHSDSVPALRPTAPMGLTIMEDTSWMTAEQNATHMRALQRLSEARIEGTITAINTYSGDDFDYVSPEGHKFQLTIQDAVTSIRRLDEDQLDLAHRGSAMSGDYGRSSPYKIAEAVGYARSQSRIADAWSNSTWLRSNEDVRFHLPRTGANPSGEFVEMLVETPHGSFDVRAVRGTGELTVAPQDTDQILSPRMTQAFLQDVTEHAEVDPSELGAAMSKTMTTATGEDW